MKGIAHNQIGGGNMAADGDGLNTRLIRYMVFAVLLSIGVSTVLGSWRITAGLLLGGVLSILNYCWLRTSITAILNIAMTGKELRARASRYLLRYFVIGAVVYIAYRLDLVSLPATIVGLSSFVAALFVEALREFYLGITHREGIG